jgi:hypothetical protein
MVRPRSNEKFRLVMARILIGLVLLDNISCAVLFLVTPKDYLPSFELQGAAGKAMVQGIGLLFVMWGVPYVFALVNPRQFRISLLEAIWMQAIGLAGESVLLAILAAGLSILRTTIMRFIVFDAAGLVLLLLAGWLTRRQTPASLSA